jgi:hypothetical protein
MTAVQIAERLIRKFDHDTKATAQIAQALLEDEHDIEPFG